MSSKFTVTIDESKTPRTIYGYVSVWLWLGWMFFYFFLVVTLPFLYYYANGLLRVIFLLIVASFLAPIDRPKQPKVYLT